MLTGQGLAQLAAGDEPAAAISLERAVAIHARYERQPAELARARFALARALSTKDPARARTLAEQARASFESLESVTASTSGEPFPHDPKFKIKNKKG